MIEPEICWTADSLTVTRAVWLRIWAVPAFLFFACLTLLCLAVPLCLNAGQNNAQNWVFPYLFALLFFFPMRLFWWGWQPLVLTLHFGDERYTLRRGIDRFARTESGRHSDIDHLTLWDETVSRQDISYTTALTWRNENRPFMLRFSYNDPEQAVEWAETVARKLNVPLRNRIRASPAQTR